jgi:hypothetical protein
MLTLLSGLGNSIHDAIRGRQHDESQIGWKTDRGSAAGAYLLFLVKAGCG